MIEKLREIFFPSKEEGKGKSKRQNALMYLSIIAMLGIFLMLMDNAVKTSNTPNDQPEQREEEAVQVFNKQSDKYSYEERLEDRLNKVLGLIEGVGRVEVDITLEQSREYVYGYNTSDSHSETEERDDTGGIRVIKDNSQTKDLVIVRDKNGEEKPVVQTEKAPIVKGVLVVADGASDPRVTAELTRAVNTVLGIELHKICVLPYKR